MQKIVINDTQELKAELALILGLDNKNNVKVATAGNVSLDVMMDLLNTVLYDALEQTVEQILHNQPSIDETELRNRLYEQAVMGFSLVMDKFHPEYKEGKWSGLTNEAIIRQQTEILKEKAAKYKNENHSD